MSQLKKPLTILTLALLSLALAQTPRDIDGTWQGTVERDGEAFEVIVTLLSESLRATLSIPERNLEAQPLLDLSVEENKLTFSVPESTDGENGALFEGVISGDKIAGMFTQDAQTSPLLLNRQPVRRVKAELTEARVLELGQSFTEQLYSGDYERLAERFTDDMREAMNAQDLEQLWQQLKGQIGGEAELLGETATFQLGLGVYQRSARFGDGTRAIVQWVVNDEEIIEGFTIRPDRS